MTRAELFTNGRSQAVRSPSEFRLDGDEVGARRDAITGDVVLSKPRVSWDAYFAWIGILDLPEDFLADREQPTDDFRDPFAPKARKKRTATN